MATTMPSLLLHLGLAAIPLAAGLAITWRLVWPRWKLLGKVAAYLTAVGALSTFVGSWSVLLAWLHQALGIAFHIRFCGRHGFTWYAVEDPERYVALSKASVRYVDRDTE